MRVIMTTSNEIQRPEGTTYQDISGTFSIIVELLMVLVNILPLAVIIKWKRYRERTTTDDIIIALSLSYIVSVLIPTPVGHISYYYQKWYGGKESCSFYQITSNWFRLTTLFLVTILAIDKSFGVYLYRTHKYTARYHGKSKVIASVVVISLFALFISCLPVMGFGPATKSRTRCECWISTKTKLKRENLFSYLFLFCGFGNFFCIVLSNLYMFWSIKKLKKNLYTGDRYRSTSNNDVRWQIEGTIVLHGVRMVMAVSGLLYITWFPALVLITLKRFNLEISDISILYALLSTSLSGLLNPIIYGLFDKSYRHGYKKILRSLKMGCKCKRNEFQSIPAVSRESNVTRSASDTVQLSKNQQRAHVAHSTSVETTASGMQNAAFSDLAHVEDMADSVKSAECSSLLKYFNKENNDKGDEKTCLLENASYFASSSAFGGPADLDKHPHSSSSSLISSHFDSQDEGSYLSSEDDIEGEEIEEEYDDSVIEESTM